MVGFEYHNPDFPFAMGGMFHGGIALGGGLDNHLKSIQTRSGIKVLMNDTEKSVTIEDPSGNIYFMDGQGNINVTAPNKIIMNATDIQMNAYNNMEINVSNNVIINAMSKFFVFTPYMKQVVSGFMGLFSGRALFSSKNTLNIEASEAKLHGTEKSIVHSDKQAIINSKGTAEMYGENGNQLSNQAQTLDASPTENIALAIVHFRPNTSWSGEFGFDWLREGDNGLATEPKYSDIIDGGYKDGATDLTGGATGTAYTQLKTQFKSIAISRKPLAAGTPAPTPPPSTEYFVPYLSLFSKQFVDAMPATTVMKPKYEAVLKVLVEIEDDIDKLEFDLSSINTATDTFINIDKLTLQDKTKTAGLVNSADATIKITCLKDLDNEKEVNIYAYPKGSLVKTPAEQLTLRKLVGKVIILKNNSTARKEEKFALVPTWTDVTKSGSIVKGTFTQQEKDNFYHILHQALIVPTIEVTANALDLSAVASFQTGGTYIDAANKLILLDLTTNGTSKPMFHAMRDLFLNNPANLAYKTGNYFTIFSSLMTPNFAAAIGCVEDIGVHNAIMLLGRRDTTLPHEAVHGLGLYHAHKDGAPIKEATRKYSYTRGTTTNIISYAPTRTTTWRWQWHIINSNISEK